MLFFLAARSLHAGQLDALPDFDVRRPLPETPQRSEELKNGRRRLTERIPDLSVDLEPITGSPKSIRAAGNFLTGPAGLGKAVTLAGHRGVPQTDRYKPVKAFLNEHAGLFGHDSAALAQAEVIREFESPLNGLLTTVWEQRFRDIPIFNAVLIGHTTTDGRLVNLSSQFLPDPPGAAKNPKSKTVARLSNLRAIANAARNVGDELLETDIRATRPQADARGIQHFAARLLKDDIDVRLVWLPMDRETMGLCWEIILTRRRTSIMYRLLVDADTGEILVRHCLTSDLSNASYRVFSSDSPSPFSPGPLSPNTNQPPYVLRSLIVTNALNTNASPNGWINDGDNETRGNNVDAHLDRDADNIPDTPRPQGSPNRVFDFPLDLTQTPLINKDAAIVNVFYWCNWYHDKTYELGFTEAAGNFQLDNIGRGGQSGDPVLADVQDGGDLNNAIFSTPPSDGTSPRMSLYIFNGPQPFRDSAFDAEIILHEHTHGLSNRRVGGGVGLTLVQSRGLGEGWSDFYALALLSQPSDPLDGNYAFAGYSSFLLKGSSQMDNYYFGIRRYPYTTEISRNPLTFKDIDPNQRSLHTGIPITSVPFIAGVSASEMHAVGEVWCSALWQARANFITKYGFATGNRLILQLVTDAMNLTPPNPNFLQARDAILQADLLNNGAANFHELWNAFASRGMGLSASCLADSDTTSGVHESFDLPDNLLITPDTTTSSIGQPGGPFFPSSQTYAITNVGSGSIGWSVTKNSTWLSLSNEFGTVSSGGPAATVTASINNKANLLPAGIYTSTLIFSNQVSGKTQSRQFTLRIGQPDYFTEIFANNNNDLAFHSWTFVPDGSGSFYSVCREPANSFPVDPRAGRRLFLQDDNATNITVVGTNSVSLYGRRTSLLYVGSNGYITFDTGDGASAPTEDVHFSRARIAALLDDLDPTAGGVISWQQLGDRVAVTFSEVPEYSTDGKKNTNSFQTELFYDGTIRLTYLKVDARGGLAGLSDGTGVPSGFAPSDFSAYPSCNAELLLALPGAVAEGNGNLAAAGRVSLPFIAATNVTVSLKSSDTSELIVPSSVLIPAGQSNGVFDVTVIDDQLLDGTQPVTVSASAPQYVSANAGIVVHDNEVATLSLSAPSTANESSGMLTGNLSVSAVVDTEVTVRLTSSDPSRLRLPSEVFLPPGTTTVSFPITVVNNNRIQGGTSVLLTAHVENWSDAVRPVFIVDDDPPILSLSLPPAVPEGAGLIPGAGRVSVPGILSSNLVISLLLSNQSRIAIPSSVILLAGQSNVFFNITAINNGLADGNQSFSIFAQATGFSSASAVTSAIDDETPPTPSRPYPAHLSTGWPAELNLSWSAPDDGSPTSYAIYFGTSTNLGASQWQGNTDATSWHVSNLSPGTVYFWKVVAQRLGAASGPVWQFTTAGTTGFDITHAPGMQTADQPFDVTIRAQDMYGQTVSNFNGLVDLRAVIGAPPPQMFSEDFESAPLSGWIGATNPLVTISEITPYRGRFALSLSGGAGDGISRPLPGLKPTRVTFAVRAGNSFSTGGALLLAGGPDPADAIALFELAAHGTMGISDAFGGAYFIPYQENRWYRIALNLDWDSHTLAFFVDDALVEQSIPFYSSAVDAVNLLRVFNQTTSLSTWDAIEFCGVSSSESIPLTPTVASNFVNGVWSGQLSIQRPELGAYLEASDVAGHFGRSDRFDVIVQRDTSLEVTVSANPLLIGDEVTYLARIFNSGPYPAENVNLFSSWSAPVNLLSAGSPAGTCSNDADGVHCLLDPIPAGTSALVSMVISVGTAGTLTNITTISGAAEAEPRNDSRTNIADVIPGRLLSILNASVAEGDTGLTNMAFSLQLDGPAQYPVVVSYEAIPGQASAGEDFLPVNGSTVLMPGVTTAQIAVPIINDLIRESNETFSLLITHSSNALILNGQAAGTIVDNDPPPKLTIGDCIVAEPTSGFAEARFPLSLDVPSGFPIQVNFNSADGTAQAGTDYFATNGTAIIPPGATNGWITVVLAHDPVTTSTEYFFVNLAIPVNASLARAQGRALIVESAAPPCVFLNDLAVVEGANAGNASALFTLFLSAPSPQTVSVSFRTQDGTATGDIDYVAMEGIATFAPGETNTVVNVPILDDSLSESNETFLLIVSDPVNCSICTSQAVGTIIEDDPLPLLTIHDLLLPEGNLGWSTGLVQVTLSAPCGRPVTVDFLSTGGSASSGFDYAPIAGSLFFPPGSTENTIPVFVHGDTLLEPDETIVLELTRSTNALLDRARGTITLVDDDGSPGILNRFDFNPVASPQSANTPFPVTIRALDAFGQVAAGFQGSVQLFALVMPPEIAIGNGSSVASQPLSTFFRRSRSQVIYLHSELGNSQTFTSLGLDIANPPGQTLSNWTIRIKHAPLASYSQASWDPSGWTTVCQTNLIISSNGWNFVPFSTPFTYNGVDNLLIDFSFANGSWSYDGLCRSTPVAQPRSLTLATDTLTNPLSWSGSSPLGFLYNQVPNIRLRAETVSVPLSQTSAGPFANGTWVGNLQIPATAQNIFLTANDQNGHLGAGNLFDVSDAGAGPFPASISLNAGAVQISWGSIPGRTYRVEYKNFLTSPSWLVLPGDVLADASTSTRTDPGPFPQQRFYRVLLLP